MVPNSQLKNDSELFDDPKAYRRCYVTYSNSSHYNKSYVT